jgi:uncharacterized C2H2 Zn-finger protein
MKEHRACRHERLDILGEALLKCESCGKLWRREKNRYVWGPRAGRGAN